MHTLRNHSAATPTPQTPHSRKLAPAPYTYTCFHMLLSRVLLDTPLSQQGIDLAEFVSYIASLSQWLRTELQADFHQRNVRDSTAMNVRMSVSVTHLSCSACAMKCCL